MHSYCTFFNILIYNNPGFVSGTTFAKFTIHIIVRFHLKWQSKFKISKWNIKKPFKSTLKKVTP